MHMAQLMPLPLTVSCFSKIQIGFTCPFLVPAHLGSPGQRAVKLVGARIVCKAGSMHLSIHLSIFHLSVCRTVIAAKIAAVAGLAGAAGKCRECRVVSVSSS